MKLTKYKHACFTLEKDGRILVVDPGALSPDFRPVPNIAGVVVTHEHPDHFDPDTLAAIHSSNPNSLLIADQTILDKMPGFEGRAVKAGDNLELGPFRLEFFGGEHAHIHPSVPVIPNVGVLIDGQVYYPGDSFTLPAVPVDVLAVPLGAPWLKTAEALDFLTEVQPRFAFPTHDAVLSADGQAFGDSWMRQFAEKAGITYQRIDAQTIDL